MMSQVQAQKKRQQQQELIAELRRRQAKDHRPVYEGKDGTIEDIITGGVHCKHGPNLRSKVTVVLQSSPCRKYTVCYVIRMPQRMRHNAFQVKISTQLRQ